MSLSSPSAACDNSIFVVVGLICVIVDLAIVEDAGLHGEFRLGDLVIGVLVLCAACTISDISVLSFLFCFLCVCLVCEIHL